MKNRLKLLRASRGLTLRELSKLTNISHSNISRLENGDVSLNQDYLITFSNFFDVSTDYLLGLSNIRKPKKEDNIDTDDFQFALYDKTKNLSDRQKKDILNIIDVLSTKEEKEEKDGEQE